MLAVSVTTLSTLSADTVFTLAVEVIQDSYPKTQLSCYPFQSHTLTRTLVEFEALYESLGLNNPSLILPSPPIPSLNTRLLMSSAQRFLNALCTPTLQSHEFVLEFLTSQFQFVPPSPTPSRPSSGSRKRTGIWASLLGSPVRSPVKDIDSYFEDALVRVQALEHGFTSLGRQNDQMTRFGYQGACVCIH